MTELSAIRQAMAKLSNAHRAIIFRAYYLKHSTAQMAAELDLAEPVVRTKLHDAMTELRRILLEVNLAV
jgi:RNA polymerase sigma-70 factor (ECF subfamily)